MGEEKDEETGKCKNIMSRVKLIKRNSDDEEQNFQINNKYLFFHNRHKITFFDFDDEFFDENLQSIKFEVDENNDTTHIKQIRMSIDWTKICIITGEEEGNVIFSWNLELNCENIMHDVCDHFRIIWDNKG